jgi:release factor glutamine methyltransferase
MSSIQFVLVRATKTLTPASDAPALDAEVLLSVTLNKERSYLRAWPEQSLTPEQLETFNGYIEQRLQGVPLAYIVGQREFWSRDFIVNNNVLIPRHDTELIIELSLKRIPRNTALKVIDLGTGSGIIAITLAVERPKIEVFACDINTEALTIAKLNAKKHHVSRIKFYQSDWFENLPETNFDFIISNPPYIAADDPHLHQGDLRFEPHTSLVSSKQGLHDIERIIDSARQHLNSQGFLIIEHGYDQKTQVKSLFNQFDYQHVETFLDLSGNPRVTCGQWLSQGSDNPTINIHDMQSSPQEITIPRKLMQQLLHAAQETPDLEVCGLIGAENNIPCICYPIRNVSSQPQTRFQLDAKQQITTFKHMREQGETLFGIYHSHPTGPATPSKTDVQLSAYPEALHFIISLNTKGVLELRCFKIVHALTQEIALNITD